MRKTALGTAIVLIILTLASCSPLGSRVAMLNASKDEQEADARAEQIVNAIKKQDGETLKSLYSEKALREAENFDSEMEILFKFFKGNIISWERESNLNSGETVDHGERTKVNRIYISIETDIDSYEIFVIDYYMDTIDPENEGLYTLQVRTSEYDDGLGSWQARMRPGFYIPEALGK